LVSRNANFSKVPGLVFFNTLRRDAPVADDGYNYIDLGIWKNKEAYDEYKNSVSAEWLPPVEFTRKVVRDTYDGKLCLVSSLGP